MLRTILIALVLVLVIAGGGYVYYTSQQPQPAADAGTETQAEIMDAPADPPTVVGEEPAPEAGSVTSSGATIELAGAFAHVAPEAMVNNAVYFTLVNNGPATELIGAATDRSSSAMIHESRDVDGVMRMEHRSSVAVPAGGSVSFAPGGLHVMMMGLDGPMAEGESFTLTLEFASGESASFTVPVVGF